MFSSHLIKRSLMGGLAIAAVGFSPVAQAMVIGGGGSVPVAPPATAPAVQQQLDRLQSNVQNLFAAEGGWPSAASSVSPTATSPGAFHWGDAGIGAATATALLGIGVLGASVTRRRRRVIG